MLVGGIAEQGTGARQGSTAVTSRMTLDRIRSGLREDQLTCPDCALATTSSFADKYQIKKEIPCEWAENPIMTIAKCRGRIAALHQLLKGAS